MVCLSWVITKGKIDNLKLTFIMFSKFMCVPKQDMISVLSAHQIESSQTGLIHGGNSGGGSGSGHNDNDEVTKG